MKTAFVWIARRGARCACLVGVWAEI